MATFDRHDYETRLDEIGVMLGDLWVIDQMLPSKVDLSAPYGVEMTLGVTYPFQVQLVGPIPTQPAGSPASHYTPDLGAMREALEAKHAQVKSSGTSWGKGCASAARAALVDVVRTPVGEFQAAADTAQSQVADGLATSSDHDFGMLANSLGHWEGAAADEFADYFYNSLQGCVDVQFLATQGVIAGLAGGKAIVNQAQHSVMGLVVAVHDVLDQQLQQRREEHGAKGMSAADWMVLGSLALSLITAIPTGGGSIGVAMSVASASSALLGFAASEVEEGDQEQLSASDALDVADYLADWAQQILTRVDTQWEALADKVAEFRGRIADAEAIGRLFPRRPGLADGTTPTDFHHDSRGA
jgi:hypothetical protein